ncbi:VOC family protein [Novosphingobium sp. KCTC 2891]|uniref:VOC family protein n=1 Tax=Novosphingobium sp. KCTC 2891 TaxID=2989730 RepID=UPI002222CFA6|nr:VOC family protein [Novosphingobium sp. KCTC 2891]MCW1381647.1 VOC family protein [Novosphingobium sp. KCTC 2891]
MHRATDYRLRQVAAVVSDLEASLAQVQAVLGLTVGHRDPGVAKYGLVNAVLPIGAQFLELVAPTRPGTPAGRYHERRGGDAGYMLILQAGSAEEHRRRLAGLGVFGIEYCGGEAHGSRTAPSIDGVQDAGLSAFAQVHHMTHFHPRDFTGILASIDSAPTAADWRAPTSDWYPAGTEWRGALTDFCTGIRAVDIQSADPAAAAAQWGRMLDLPVEAEGVPTVRLGDARLRFVAAQDADGTGFVRLEVGVRSAQQARAAAQACAALDAAGRVRLCGMEVELVEDPA